MPRKGKSPAAAPAAEPLAGEVGRRTEKHSTTTRQHFDFALQNRFRGPESEVREKLRPYLSEIQQLSPPQGRWIDLGCGRGEWLAVLREAAVDGEGVDENQFAIARCRELDLTVERQDALRYLRELPDESAAVLTAFHFFEHCQPDYLLDLVREGVRVLAPAGLIAIETPEPAHSLVGMNSFWLDPSHVHPIPRELADFLFEYCGMAVLSRANIEHQGGSVRDYGVIARRRASGHA